jgi:hypothetical protein
VHPDRGRAEALAAAGITTCSSATRLIAPTKLQRVMTALAQRLHERGGRLAIAVDSDEGIARLAQAMRARPRTLADVVRQVDISQEPLRRGAGAAVLERCARWRRMRLFCATPACRPTTAAPSTCARWPSAARPSAPAPSGCAPRARAAGRGRAGAAAGHRRAPAHLRLRGRQRPVGRIQPGSFLFMDAGYARNELTRPSPCSSRAVRSSRRSSAGRGPRRATPATRTTPSTAACRPCTPCPASPRWWCTTAATRPASCAPWRLPAASCAPCRRWATPCG